MATAVLTPQDCLRDPFVPHGGGLLSTPRPTRSRRSPNPTPSSSSSKHGRGQSNNNNRRKRSPNSSPPPRPAAVAIGQVKILKRGEEIQSIHNKIDDSARSDVVQKIEMKLDLAVSPPVTPKKPVRLAAPLLNGSAAGFYAGSGFFTSPPPSSLPVPVFLKKSAVVVRGGVDSDATNDLRRLLNLAL